MSTWEWVFTVWGGASVATLGILALADFVICYKQQRKRRG